MPSAYVFHHTSIPAGEYEQIRKAVEAVAHTGLSESPDLGIAGFVVDDDFDVSSLEIPDYCHLRRATWSDPI